MSHLPGACGGQKFLPHHGVPRLQTRLVPQGLHPGRSRSLTPGTRQALGSTRASLLLLMFPLQGRASCAGIAFRCPLCRDRNDFLPEMFFMGINMPLRLVSCRLTGQEAASPGSCQGLPLQSWPSAVPSAWASASRRGCKPGRGEEQGCSASALCRGSRGSAISLSPSEIHHGTTSLQLNH